VSLTADRYRAAARGYFVYGVVYWIGGVYLLAHGVGVEGGRGAVRGAFLSFWALVGLVLVVSIPFLLRQRRPWFERWVLSRRDFARVLALFLLFRAVKVGHVALRSDTGAVPSPWGGTITFQAGAAVFFVVTVVCLVLVARAAWQPESAPSAES
jgi:hypothetical protein